MTPVEILLISIIVPIFIDLVRLEKREILNKKKMDGLSKQIILVDRDIKTLHLNQKVLQSTIKELHKELKVYGEVKKSRVRFLQETPEEE